MVSPFLSSPVTGTLYKCLIDSPNTESNIAPSKTLQQYLIRCRIKYKTFMWPVKIFMLSMSLVSLSLQIQATPCHSHHTMHTTSFTSSIPHYLDYTIHTIPFTPSIPHYSHHTTLFIPHYSHHSINTTPSTPHYSHHTICTIHATLTTTHYPHHTIHTTLFTILFLVSLAFPFLCSEYRRKLFLWMNFS